MSGGQDPESKLALLKPTFTLLSLLLPINFIYYKADTHRDDLPTHPHRFVACVTEEVPVDGNGFPMVLIGPAGIVTSKEKVHT